MLSILKDKFLKRWLIIAFVILFVVILSLVASYIIFEYKYKFKIYPGVFIGKIELSGLSYTEAEKLINTKKDLINQEGITFTYHNESASLMPLAVSVNADIAYQIIDFHTDDSLDLAYNHGRTGNFVKKLKQKIQTLINNYSYPLYYGYNKDEVKKFLLENFSRFETPAEDANLTYEKKPYSNTYEFSTEDEKYGQIINYDRAISQFENNLQRLDLENIDMEAIIDYPQIKKSECLNIESKANLMIANAPINLKYDNESWIIDKETLVELLKIKKDSLDNDKVFLGLDLDSSSKYLATTISPIINIEPIEAKFEINNGKVSEFKASQDGVIFDAMATSEILEKNLLENKTEDITIIVQEIKSQTQTSDINSLGIKEIIGTGHSSFAGSPQNRRHNIRVGANAVNGTLIKPSEEFSLIDVLGDINAETGYLPELVIKEGRTIPEYGGGLCQIGTTVFRGTVDSGLPVTMRRNHSYRVSYYEPAGTDATIYDPWPNYKFLNDTPYHILILSRIEGDDIYFDFWSTEDGRVASSTYPVIYNITKPGPTKIIETLDLEPGVKRCTEHAHNGADAYFDYQIKYPDGKIDDTRFKSHYVPWREVCLLGVEELSEDKNPISASSTDAQVAEGAE